MYPGGHGMACLEVLGKVSTRVEELEASRGHAIELSEAKQKLFSEQQKLQHLTFREDQHLSISGSWPWLFYVKAVIMSRR